MRARDNNEKKLEYERTEMGKATEYLIPNLIRWREQLVRNTFFILQNLKLQQQQNTVKWKKLAFFDVK